jgi:hypothetical protein
MLDVSGGTAPIINNNLFTFQRIAAGGRSIVVRAGVTGSMIVGNTIHNESAFAVGSGVDTVVTTGSKIIRNIGIGLGAGTITSAVGDVVTENVAA